MQQLSSETLDRNRFFFLFSFVERRINFPSIPISMESNETSYSKFIVAKRRLYLVKKEKEKIFNQYIENHARRKLKLRRWNRFSSTDGINEYSLLGEGGRVFLFFLASIIDAWRREHKEGEMVEWHLQPWNLPRFILALYPPSFIRVSPKRRRDILRVPNRSVDLQRGNLKDSFSTRPSSSVNE